MKSFCGFHINNLCWFLSVKEKDAEMIRRGGQHNKLGVGVCSEFEILQMTSEGFGHVGTLRQAQGDE